MTLADFGNLGGGMTVAGADLAQVFARHAIEAVNGIAVVAGRDQQFVERRPIVAPVKVEANALPQFAFVNFAAPPFLEDVLVAGKDCFRSEHDWAISSKSALLEERCGI